jgi:hypothetical protein
MSRHVANSMYQKVKATYNLEWREYIDIDIDTHLISHEIKSFKFDQSYNIYIFKRALPLVLENIVLGMNLDKCLSRFILKIVFFEQRKYFIISLIIFITILCIIDTSISLYVRLIKF